MALRTFTALSAALVSSIIPISPSAASSMTEIMRSSYPQESLALGEQGTVEFAIDLDDKARIDSCLVTRSSGYARLDAATCDMLVLHAQFAPAQTEDGNAVATTRTGRVNWKLPAEYSQNAARAPRPASFTKAQLDAKRLICKRATATGSMLKTKAHCLTWVEWNEADAIAKEQVKKFINPTHATN